MKVLVCGGRDFQDAAHLEKTLDTLDEVELVIHGGASGADSMAGRWASSRNVPVQVFPADWEKHGRAAGAIRNWQMLREGKPDLVVAFKGGRGTADMVSRARRAGVPVLLPLQKGTYYNDVSEL